jgi:hypothetical protein
LLLLHQERDIIGSRCDAGIFGGVPGHPVIEIRPVFVVADGDDEGLETLFNRLHVSEELRADHDHLRLRVIDDVQHLRRGQLPIHGYADGSEFGESTDDLEEFGAVLLDERDPVAEPDACGPERLCDLAGAGV